MPSLLQMLSFIWGASHGRSEQPESLEKQVLFVFLTGHNNTLNKIGILKE